MLKFSTPQEEQFFYNLSPQQQQQYLQLQQQQHAQQQLQKHDEQRKILQQQQLSLPQITIKGFNGANQPPQIIQQTQPPQDQLQQQSSPHFFTVQFQTHPPVANHNTFAADASPSSSFSSPPSQVPSPQQQSNFPSDQLQAHDNGSVQTPPGQYRLKIPPSPNRDRILAKYSFRANPFMKQALYHVVSHDRERKQSFASKASNNGEKAIYFSDIIPSEFYYPSNDDILAISSSAQFKHEIELKDAEYSQKHPTSVEQSDIASQPHRYFATLPDASLSSPSFMANFAQSLQTNASCQQFDLQLLFPITRTLSSSLGFFGSLFGNKSGQQREEHAQQDFPFMTNHQSQNQTMIDLFAPSTYKDNMTIYTQEDAAIDAEYNLKTNLLHELAQQKEQKEKFHNQNGYSSHQNYDQRGPQQRYQHHQRRRDPFAELFGISDDEEMFHQMHSPFGGHHQRDDFEDMFMNDPIMALFGGGHHPIHQRFQDFERNAWNHQQQQQRQPQQQMQQQQHQQQRNPFGGLESLLFGGSQFPFDQGQSNNNSFPNNLQPHPNPFFAGVEDQRAPMLQQQYNAQNRQSDPLTMMSSRAGPDAALMQRMGMGMHPFAPFMGLGFGGFFDRDPFDEQFPSPQYPGQVRQPRQGQAFGDQVWDEEINGVQGAEEAELRKARFAPQRMVSSWSSSTMTRVGPDGVAKTEHQEEERFDDGTEENRKHRKLVEKKVRGATPHQIYQGDREYVRVDPMEEVQRVESDLKTGDTKVLHKRQIGDKGRERVQEMNMFESFQTVDGHSGEQQVLAHPIHSVVKENLYNMDENELDEFQQRFDQFKHHIDRSDAMDKNPRQHDDQEQQPEQQPKKRGWW